MPISRYALHVGLPADDTLDHRDVSERIATDVLRRYGPSLIGVNSDGDSFLEWGEGVFDDESAFGAFGRLDRYHVSVYFVASSPHALDIARTMYRLLVDARLADPTADCSPDSRRPAPWALTDADDWSICYHPVPAASVTLSANDWLDILDILDARAEHLFDEADPASLADTDLVARLAIALRAAGVVLR